MAEKEKNAAPSQGGQGDGPERSAKRRKKFVVIGVVVAVLVVAGVGFWTWHEQPSFCYSICHTPMDAYAASYEDGSVDKYGNEIAEEDRGALMSNVHRELDGTTCMGCHVPTMSEQISEGMHWLSGDYELIGYNALNQAVLEERGTDDLTAARGVAGDEFCMNDACHADVTRETLQDKTADLSETRNPHNFHHTDLACSTCHKSHAQSVNYCSKCHDDAPIPDGWLTVDEAEQIQKVG